MRGGLSNFCVQPLPHFDSSDGDGNRAVSVINWHQRVQASEILNMKFHGNNRDATFDPTVGCVEIVNKIFTAVIRCFEKLLLILKKKT